MLIRAILLVFAALPLAAQDTPTQRWALDFQATSIGQYHGYFRSPYEGTFSLVGHPESEASLTSTLFFGLRLGSGTQFYFDPELAGGRGFSNTNGIANFPNGEMPRVRHRNSQALHRPPLRHPRFRLSATQREDGYRPARTSSRAAAP